MSNTKSSPNTSSALSGVDPSSIVLARLLLPDDANLSRTNVHGGVILHLMEQAGMIAATRYFNSDPNHCYHGKQFAGLARFETMNFLEPIHVGELASLTASLVFTSQRSLLVRVTVVAENAQTGNTRVTNTGMLWYLSFVDGSETQRPSLADISQLAIDDLTDSEAKKAYMKGKKMYETRKQQEEELKHKSLEATPRVAPAQKELSTTETNNPSRTVAESKQTLCQVVLPSDCGFGRLAHAGFVMKLMDTAAGCTAFRHARTNVVTISVSAMDFEDFVLLGDLVTITSTMTFCSDKSMEILVEASTTSTTRSDTLVARGTFTFVALDPKTRKVVSVPRLQCTTDEEYELFYKSQMRYEAAKQSRIAKATKAREAATASEKRD